MLFIFQELKYAVKKLAMFLETLRLCSLARQTLLFLFVYYYNTNMKKLKRIHMKEKNYSILTVYT